MRRLDRHVGSAVCRSYTNAMLCQIVVSKNAEAQKEKVSNRYGLRLYRVGGIGFQHPSQPQEFCNVQESVTPKATLFRTSPNGEGQNTGGFESRSNGTKRVASRCGALPVCDQLSENELDQRLSGAISQYPALSRIVNAWPILPPHIQETIKTIVESCIQLGS